MNKVKSKSMFLLWPGAAISIAEIYTGGLTAPLGLAKGSAAIVLGHLIGGLLLALGGSAVAFINVLQPLDYGKNNAGGEHNEA